MQQQKAQNTRIVGDPFACENDWQAACLAMTETGSTVDSWSRGSAPSWFLGFTALVVSGVVGIAGTLCVSLAFDWGYLVVENLFTQPTGAAQGGIAIFLLWFLVWPLFFGFAMGCFKTAWQGRRLWFGSAVIPAIAVLPYAVDLTSSWTSDPFLYWGLVASLFSASLAIFIGQRAYAELKPRVRIRPILGFSALAVGLVGLVSFLEPDHGLIELTVYSLLLLASGAWAAKLGRSRTKIGAMLIAQLAIFPIIIVNTINVGLTLVSLSLDQVHSGLGLGWQALASAILISFVSFIATTAGALLTFKLRKAES